MLHLMRCFVDQSQLAFTAVIDAVLGQVLLEESMGTWMNYTIRRFGTV